MPFYVYNNERTEITEVNETFNPSKVQMHSDKIIPLEFVKFLNGDVFDKRDIIPFKEKKMREMDFVFNECTRKGSETCYVITSVTSKLTGEKIIMDNAEIDLTNIKGLIELMDLYDQTETVITDYYNNYHPNVTFEEVVDIKYDMLLRGAGLHQSKAVTRGKINNANTVEELDAIVWDYEAKSKV